MTHPAVFHAAPSACLTPSRERFPLQGSSGLLGKRKRLADLVQADSAAFKAPRHIWILESGGLPENHNGKVLRRELRGRYSHEIH
ncbi:MAG: hypothetical protein WB561_23895 [Terracidiphilus sp.]